MESGECAAASSKTVRKYYGYKGRSDSALRASLEAKCNNLPGSRKRYTFLASTDEEVEGLRLAVRRGRLFDVQEWIASRKPLFFCTTRKKQALAIAVETGFHSMVQILAEVWPDQVSLDKAAEQAARKRRPDLVWLLLECGADMRAVSFEALATCCDKDLMRHFLEHWNEIGSDRGLTEIVLSMPRPLTGLIKEYATRIPNYQIQLGAALNQFINDGHLRWIALTMWMGADPRVPAPVPSWSSPDPESYIAPIEHAVWNSNLDALKMMKVSGESDDLNALVASASTFRAEENAHVIEFLLEQGASMNNKPNGGSSIIDSLLSPHWTFHDPKPRSSVWALERWIDRGARFVPNDSDAYRRAREGLRNVDAHDLRRAIKILSRATEQDTLLKLFDTPKLRGILGFTSSQLKDDICSTYRRAEEKLRAETEPPGWATQTVFKQMKPRIVVARCASLSRIELYDALWSRSASQVSKELGVSDVWLAKVCKAHRIPKPPLGYWAKVEHGHRASKKRLSDSEWNPTIDIATYAGLPPITDQSAREEVQLIVEHLSGPDLSIEIPSKTKTWHRHFRDSQDPDSPNEPLFDDLLGREFCVNRPLWQMDKNTVIELRKRAIRVINAFLYFAESYGFQFEIESTNYGYKYMHALLLDESVRFDISREGRKLRLQCFGLPFTSRSSWSDGKRHFVESYFADFACTLAYSAAIQKCERASKREK